MKSVIFKNKNGKVISSPNHYEDPTEFINHIVSTNYFGLPERWVLEMSEPYEADDVLQTEQRTFTYTAQELNELGHTVEVQKERSETWVLLRAEYTIEIIDLESDYDWLLSECHRSRVAEYPPITELGDALYWKENGDSSRYEKYIQKCDEVKKKYPLPTRSE